ncbi:DUF397 domain-containing protein [Streptomyces sp. SAJ15]|uniref:DUF397 domain-containing protein n=1 Tax=Streptomyces sp. SAJ15 TaxID=2011095 RepID=UPI001185A46F|nr:DUF397 domain-containing protein [Streptomyces sp. SAJ15]TVL93757.1 DUF397 domain-containing protein [Streptomyces sp. SAJ15]
MAIQRGKQSMWTKSSYSTTGACVEVASPTAVEIAVRDSKNPQGPALGFAPEAWSAFVTDVNRGAFDID